MDVPEGARVFGDTGYNSAADEARIREATEVCLIPVRRKNRKPHAWFVDALEVRAYRHAIETVNRQAEAMGLERLHARTNAGFELNVHASLVALPCWNANEHSRYSFCPAPWPPVSTSGQLTRTWMMATRASMPKFRNG